MFSACGYCKEKKRAYRIRHLIRDLISGFKHGHGVKVNFSTYIIMLVMTRKIRQKKSYNFLLKGSDDLLCETYSKASNGSTLA